MTVSVALIYVLLTLVFPKAPGIEFTFTDSLAAHPRGWRMVFVHGRGGLAFSWITRSCVVALE